MFETDSDDKNNSSHQLENDEEDIEHIEVVKKNCEEHKRLSTEYNKEIGGERLPRVEEESHEEEQHQ